jgi:hypothetical protein
MKVYITGAVTGTENYLEKFAKAEEQLREQGYEVINPARVNSHLPRSTTYAQYMQMCSMMLNMADAIYMLSDCHLSNGSVAEIKWAKAIGLIILDEQLWMSR